MTPEVKLIGIAQRAQDLFRLAADSAASDNEARNAALTAARLVVQHDLLVSPRFVINQERDKRRAAEAREVEAR